MNAENILFALTDIEDSYIRDAQNHMSYGAVGHRKTSCLKRTLLVAAVLLLLVVASFTTAMAASGTFREKVFRFLQIQQEPVVEDSIDKPITTKDMYAEDTFTIGETITGQYVHTPVASHARVGVYLVCTDPVEMRQASHYDAYLEQNGEFIQLENHDFRKEYTLYGCPFTIDGTWAERDGSAFFTWLPSDASIRTYNQYDSTQFSMVLVHLTLQNAHGMEYYTSYPVLLDLHTGELSDVLAGTQAYTLPGIEHAAITPDQTKMLLQQTTQSGYKLFYADLVKHRLYDLDELSGQRTDACTVIDDVLTCWQNRGDSFQIWKIDLNTMERTELVKHGFNSGMTPAPDAGIQFLQGFDNWNHSGNMYAGTHFAVLVDDEQAVSVLDLKNGEVTPVPGLVWPQDVERIASPDGKKLLLTKPKSDSSDTYIGVLDFTQRQYVEFTQTNNQPREEGYPYWFTNDAVIFMNSVSWDSYCSDYHVYRLHPDY